jgi:hypothetical protein
MFFKDLLKTRFEYFQNRNLEPKVTPRVNTTFRVESNLTSSMWIQRLAPWRVQNLGDALRMALVATKVAELMIPQGWEAILTRPSATAAPLRTLARDWVALTLSSQLYDVSRVLMPSLYLLLRRGKSSLVSALIALRRSIGDGWLYIQGLAVALFIDACLTDDEPLWEPVEWSLVQSWIMFIFLFAWIAENLISSRYGSYTGRDKRVWFSWYKTFWLVEGWYLISLGAAGLWVIIPHYYELNYLISYVVAWWDWYSREFFSTLLSIYTIVLYLAYDLLLKIRWMNWKKALLTTLIINLFLAYLLYVQFFMAFFGYFTTGNWYRKVRLVDYIQMSHEPHRWGYGLGAKCDHFLNHGTKNRFWFKNDGPYASFFMFISFFVVLSLFFLNFFWLSLARRIYATKEVSFTYTTYCVSALKQFLLFCFFFFLLVVFSYGFIFWRLPMEFYWQLTPVSTISSFSGLVMQLLSESLGGLSGVKGSVQQLLWSFLL